MLLALRRVISGKVPEIGVTFDRLDKDGSRQITGDEHQMPSLNRLDHIVHTTHHLSAGPLLFLLQWIDTMIQ